MNILPAKAILFHRRGVSRRLYYIATGYSALDYHFDRPDYEFESLYGRLE